MLGQEQSDSALSQQIKLWAAKFIELKTSLLAARGEIDRMVKIAPAEIRQEVGHLGKRQGELERRFFEIEGRLLTMAQEYGYPLPGLSGLADNPVSLLASAVKLYWDATAHIQRVADYRSRVSVGSILPGAPETGWGIGTYLVIGIGAYLLIRALR